MATPQYKNPFPGGDEIYSFSRPILCRHFYIYIVLLSLSDLFLGVEKNILFIRSCPSSRTPVSGVMKIYDFGRPFLGHHYYTISLSGPGPREEKILKKYINFTPKLPPLGLGCHEIYNFLSPYPGDVTYQIWLKKHYSSYSIER